MSREQWGVGWMRANRAKPAEPTIHRGCNRLSGLRMANTQCKLTARTGEDWSVRFSVGREETHTFSVSKSRRSAELLCKDILVHKRNRNDLTAPPTGTAGLAAGWYSVSLSGHRTDRFPDYRFRSLQERLKLVEGRPRQIAESWSHGAQCFQASRKDRDQRRSEIHCRTSHGKPLWKS